ncbi:hypothetical protein ACFFRR_004608 [Megaselia abdita]
MEKLFCVVMVIILNNLRMEAVTINRTKLQPVSGEKIPLLNLTCPLDRKDIPLNKNWSKRPWTIPTSYPEFVDRALDFKVRYDDIWILGQQKTGTTWMQDMAWLITHNFDFKTSENSHVYERSVNLEYTGVYQPFAGTEAEKKGVSSFAATENMTSPRIIKSHLSPNMLPKELWTKKPKSMKNSKAGQTLQKIMEDIHGTSGEFKFIRRGEIGSHKDELPEGYSEKMDNWSERSLVGSGVAMDDILSFSYK